MKLNCIIVDDEPLARKVIEQYIEAVPSLRLEAECNTALEALAYLHDHRIDLIFLDIKMPGITGMDMLKTLTNPPLIIITTAYSEYAVEGYEYSVIDYLMKPIPFNRFLKAVNKALDQLNKISISEELKTEPKESYILVKADKSMHKLSYTEIKYFEGYGNFIKVFTDKKKLLITETLSNMEQKLPSSLFIRVHKSFIVPIMRIREISGNTLRLDDQEIPIGRFFKKGLEEKIKK